MKTKPTAMLVAAFFLTVLTLGVFEVGATNSAYAATAEELREQNIKDFNEWRSNIPDYEKRLYDRVKSITSRQIQSRNMIIIVLVIFFLVSPFWLRLFLGRASGGGVRGAVADGGAASGGPIDARAIEKIVANQEALADLLLKLEQKFESTHAEIAEIEKRKREFKAMFEQCSVIVAEIEKQSKHVVNGTST